MHSAIRSDSIGCFCQAAERKELTTYIYTRWTKRTVILASCSFNGAFIHNRCLSLLRIIFFLTEVSRRRDLLLLTKLYGLLDVIIHCNTSFTKEMTIYPTRLYLTADITATSAIRRRGRRNKPSEIIETLFTPKEHANKDLDKNDLFSSIGPSDDNFSPVPNGNTLSLGVVVRRPIASLVNTELGKQTSIRLRRRNVSVYSNSSWKPAFLDLFRLFSMTK